MVAVFSHWGYPLLIMASLPVGISGGIAGLYLLNLGGAHLDKIGLYPIQQSFDMITMLGFLVLIGTVVNNPILIVEQAVRNLKTQGMAVVEAVMEAVRIRLRPIMMSMVTTVAGLSPLVFYPSAGTELYRGLGAIVLFGLLFSTLVTLTFMPALLALVFKVSWVQNKNRCCSTTWKKCWYNLLFKLGVKDGKIILNEPESELNIRPADHTHSTGPNL